VADAQRIVAAAATASASVASGVVCFAEPSSGDASGDAPAEPSSEPHSRHASRRLSASSASSASSVAAVSVEAMPTAGRRRVFADLEGASALRKAGGDASGNGGDGSDGGDGGDGGSGRRGDEVASGDGDVVVELLRALRAATGCHREGPAMAEDLAQRLVSSRAPSQRLPRPVNEHLRSGGGGSGGSDGGGLRLNHRRHPRLFPGSTQAVRAAACEEARRLLWTDTWLFDAACAPPRFKQDRM